jgi:hypothetical protein
LLDKREIRDVNDDPLGGTESLDEVGAGFDFELLFAQI